MTDRDNGRYVGRETEDGAVRIEDSENDDAWIRCEEPVELSWQA